MISSPWQILVYAAFALVMVALPGWYIWKAHRQPDQEKK